MAVEQILKSWLRQKYTDNNTLYSSYGAGTNLTVPNTSNTSALATDINTLVTSLRAMQSNVYLRYSPLWSTVDITNVTAQNLILETKKTAIDSLLNDLLAMNANYSKTPTDFTNKTANVSTFGHNASNATAFSQNNGNVTRFTQNSGNVTRFSRDNGTSYGFNHTNEKYTFNRSNSPNFVFRAGFSNFFRDSDSTSYTFFNTNSPTFGFFASNSPTFGFFASNSPTFTQDSTNATRFTRDTRFSQRFNYSFIVKSDGSTTSHSNVGS